MSHKPWHSPPGASGPPGRNYPVSKPSPAPPGEKGGGGYVEPKQEKKVEGLLSQPPEKEDVEYPKVISEGTTMIYPDVPPGEKGGGGYQSAYDKYLARKIINDRKKKKTKKKKTFKSTIRDVASSVGVPSSFAALGYGLMAGDKENIPLSEINFTDKQLYNLKKQALAKLKQIAEIKGTGLLYQKPVIVKLYKGSEFDIMSPLPYFERSLGNTLGDATAYINNEGELIVTDYYDWETQVGLSNPDTGLNPTTVSEWAYTVNKQVDLYLTDLEGEGKGDYMRPYKKSSEMYEGSLDMVEADYYNISYILMDAAESLANIIGPKKYKEKSIFDVPEENRMILNLGKVQ